MANEIIYGDGSNSSVEATGNAQIRQDYYDKKAVIDIQDEMYLAKLSGTTNMPKHYGETIKKYRYIPLLDDENDNSQGLDTSGSAIAAGNIYGSSRDIGTINSKLPDLSETGGRVNRVGFTRKQITASIANRGFFFEWTKDSMNFDSDAELKMHLTREAVRGAAQINEDILYISLVNNAGVNYFGGAATTVATVTGEVDDATAAVPTYTDLLALDVELTNNKCPRDTKVIDGSRMIDTKVVRAARYMFISPDVEISFRAMTNLHGDPAFKDVSEYTNANKDGKYIKALNGEIGAVGPFRIVVHPNAVMRIGAGAAVTNNLAGLRNDGSNYDVYPCLVVGSEAFTHVGFEFGAGTKGKFKTNTMMPEANRSSQDPYGKTGFTAIEFWNGILVDRPEWLAVYNIGAKLY
jgi:N4-gp56 family major capsid protein